RGEADQRRRGHQARRQHRGEGADGRRSVQHGSHDDFQRPGLLLRAGARLRREDPAPRVFFEHPRREGDQVTDAAPGAALRGAVDLSALRNRPASSSQAAAPAAGGPAGNVPSLVMDVTDETFGSALELSRTVPVVVDLWAEWCGPCKQLSPILEKVVTELAGRLVLAKVDVDANPQLAQAFRAQSIPMVELG